MRKLPPLASLRAFEAAARHLSFKRAAEELAVTPTAISHQVRLLEDTLGLPLFERRVREVRLTEAGRTLYPGVRDGFDGMAAALDQVRRPTGPVPVTLSATLAFVGKWLLPRVEGLEAAARGLQLNVLASNAPADVAAGEADVAVRYGRGPWPGCRADLLFETAYAPVCSPRLAIRATTDVAGARLIHFVWTRPDATSPVWPAWFERAGLSYPAGGEALTFSDETHALQAAIAGQGVALMNLALAVDELASGALVAIGPALRGHPMWVVTPDRARAAAAAAEVRDWLLAEAQTFSARFAALGVPPAA
ncbi:LysR substrate-binding domain-containing protein [Phenylobacterium sp.]|uniref:LysR substrate-binding domain-containing protein n=1 Tax=Phenylobacterium sp. TaxID=1871053 RepID=UPI0028120053|nr:LysR substrate-binding domain-containing protein [Phenylobacterium sp.]